MLSFSKQGQIKTGAPCRSERLAKYNQASDSYVVYCNIKPIFVALLSLSLSFCNDGHCFISNYSKNRPAPLPGQNFPSTFIGWIDLYDDMYNLPCVCKINIALNPVFCLVI